MKFFRPILQTILATIILAIPIGAWKVYADVEDVKRKVKGVDALSAKIETLSTKIETLNGNYRALPEKLSDHIDKKIDRRLADVPLCRRR